MLASHVFDMPSQSLSGPPPPTFAGSVHAANAGVKSETFPKPEINKINVKKKDNDTTLKFHLSFRKVVIHLIL